VEGGLRKLVGEREGEEEDEGRLDDREDAPHHCRSPSHAL